MHSQSPQSTQLAKATELASPARLHVDLGDPGMWLALSWSLADLADAVNQRAPPQGFAEELWDEI